MEQYQSFITPTGFSCVALTKVNARKRLRNYVIMVHDTLFSLIYRRIELSLRRDDLGVFEEEFFNQLIVTEVGLMFQIFFMQIFNRDGSRFWNHSFAFFVFRRPWLKYFQPISK